jgi:KaiC/GvpD/RAD55 family RecA-like ATPase/Flp pilus assembly protein TadD
MTELIPCPWCQTMNPPDRERCHACGRSLRSPKEPANAAVGLQRVMAGEVFAAVVGNGTTRAEVDAPAETAPETAADDTADVERALASIADRFRERATASGQRFKPYSAERSRTPERPQDKAAVTRQLESAARAFRDKRYETAVEHLLRAISKDDRDPRSWALLGEAYLRCDRPFKAAVGYLQALDLEPRNSVAWLGLSRALKATGDLAGAREVLDRTITINPDLTEAWSDRGQVLEALNEKAEAAKSFAKALELRPDHPTARENYGRLSPPEPVAAETAAPPSEVTVAPPPEAQDEEDFPDFTDLAELPEKEPATPPTEEAPQGRPARVRTYIEGLDDTIAGGIPWGHVVLIEGSPGTMKSSLGFSILLHNAARDGMHCLYLSLEERTSSLLKQMGSLGLHLHVNKGSLVVLDPRAAKGLLDAKTDWIDALQTAIAAIRSQRGLDLIVIDSLEALEVLAKFQDRRREIFRLFEWLRDLDLTSFVITERPDWVVGGHVIQGRWDEDFLADGVVHLRQHLISDLEVQRRLRVVKMRGTRHDTGYLALVLDDGRFRVTRAMSP